MILITDCRQKKDKHKNIDDYCRRNNIKVVTKQLTVGDYMFPGGSIAVDSKQNILELANDLYSDSQVFNKKYRKCYKEGIKLIVLVEEEISSIDELAQWRSTHTRVTGAFLLQMIMNLRLSYGIRFYFCNKRQTPKIIFQLLSEDFSSCNDIFSQKN